MGREVRCACGRLLAVVREDGKIEIRAGRRVIVTRQAFLTCGKCGRGVELKPGQTKFGVDKSGHGG